MTDHAAEAHRHIRELQTMNWPDSDYHATSAEIHTGTALIAITHTLQAILETIGNARHAPNERCGDIRPTGNAAYPCILAIGHLPLTFDHTHVDRTGDMW